MSSNPSLDKLINLTEARTFHVRSKSAVPNRTKTQASKKVVCGGKQPLRINQRVPSNLYRHPELVSQFANNLLIKSDRYNKRNRNLNNMALMTLPVSDGKYRPLSIGGGK